MGARLMVRHRDADDLQRCPRFHQKVGARDRGADLPSPGLDVWRTVVDGLRSAYRNSEAGSFAEVMRHVVPPGEGWAGPEQRAEIQALIETYLDLADDLGGEWLEPPEDNVQVPGRSLPAVLDGRLWLAFDHGPDEVEVRKLEISSYHMPPDAEALRSEFSTCVISLLAHQWQPRARVRFTLLALRAGRAVSCVWTEADLTLAREIVRDWVVERLGRTEFPAQPNPLCTTCAHAADCPAIPHAAAVDPSRVRAALTGAVSTAAAWAVFSPTRRRVFDHCPRRYRNRHVLGLFGDARDSTEASLGLAVHRALAEAHDIDSVGHRALAAVSARVAEEMDVDPDAVAACTAQHVELCPGDGYLGGERDLFVMDDESGLLIHGRADALWATSDGGIEVRDYKTGSSEDDLGLATYAVLAAATFPECRPIRVAFEDLTAGRLVVREMSDTLLAQSLERLRTAAREMIQADAFPAVPGPLCASCAYNVSCPDAEE